VISALRNAALGVLVFFLLDAAIFRSGLYLSVVEPVSILGTELAALRRIDDASATTKPIVVIGDSRVGEGFFTKIANLQAEQAHSKYRFANASAAGSRLESQYYLLRTADPNADRFSAVVVMLETYQSSFWVRTRCRDELPFIHAFARITDYLDIARNCADFDDSMNTLTSLAVAAPNFRADLIAFLSGIETRLKTVAAWRQHGTDWVNTRLGIDHDVIGLSYDAATQSLTLPARLTGAEAAVVRNELMQRISGSAAPHTDGDYRRYWIERIVDRYAGTGTRVFFGRLPRSPLKNILSDQEPIADYLVKLQSEGKLTLLPPGLFDEFEAPRYFADGLHVNKYGREGMTRALVAAVLADMPDR
jgi:hypothetical protein